MTRRSKRELEREIEAMVTSDDDLASFRRSMVYTPPHAGRPESGEPIECDYYLTSEGERVPTDCDDIDVILPYVLHPAVEQEISQVELEAYADGEVELAEILPREKWVVQ